MTDTIVISADWGLMHCLDRWAVLLIWRNTKDPSVLWDSTVFYPIITSQVIISKYSTIYSQSHARRKCLNITCNISRSCVMLRYHLAYAWLRQGLRGITMELSWIPQSFAYKYLGRTEPGHKMDWCTSHKRGCHLDCKSNNSKVTQRDGSLVLNKDSDGSRRIS